jgi:murein DD-endopeptidase MepM/ murein hydrolase activator NlpD
VRPFLLLLLGGFLALTPDLRERWCPSGAWIFPVGDPYDCLSPATGGGAVFQLSRNVAPDGCGHQGADLSSGSAGEPVRAAATGLVVSAPHDGWQGGYGGHVVLAHRTPDGTFVYSVYAHLAPKSVSVHPGQVVHAGQRIGRVGSSGRVTAPHLHFEVRIPDDPAMRWEKARIVDPIAFVTARLSTQRADTSWARPYLEWAEQNGLIERNAIGEGPVRSGDWWRMLAIACRTGIEPTPGAPESVAVALRDTDLLDSREPVPPNRPLSWNDVAGQLARAQVRGLRLGPGPVRATARRRDCVAALGHPTVGPLPRLARRAGAPPTLAQVCFLLADLSGDPASAKRVTKRSGS